MYTELTSLSVRPGAMDQLIRHLQDSLPARLAGEHSFVGMLLLTDDHAGQAIALLLWDTEAALLASCAGQHQWFHPAPVLLNDQPRSASYKVSVRIERTEQGSLWLHGI